MRARSASHLRSSFTEPYDPPSLARMVLLALALFALVLPIVGPLDDHHFAERSHSHAHIYLDGRPISHEHPGAKALPHPHPGTSDVSPDADSVETVYLTNATASLLLAVMNAPYHGSPESLRPTPARGDEANLLTPYRVRHSQPTGRQIIPLLPPPIA